jgi:hypothetical protein
MCRLRNLSPRPQSSILYQRFHSHTMLLRSVRRLIVTANVVTSSPILVTPMKEALSSSKGRFLQDPHGIPSQKTAFFTL